MEKKPITLTLESKVPVNPERSLLPVLLLADRLIVKWQKPSEKIEGTNFIKPVSHQESSCRGIIVTLGDEQMIHPSIKLGQYVKYHPNYAEEMEIDKEKYHMIRQSDVVMIL